MNLKGAASIGGIGAAAAYFFDPKLGRTRRNQLVDRTKGIFRRGVQRAERKASYLAGHAYGIKEKAAAAARHDRPAPNDPALVAKVESEVLSRGRYPKKGSIHINSEEGVVYLRGEAENSDQISDLEREVRKVGGVADVVNMLHLPGTPAPNKQEALEASRR